MRRKLWLLFGALFVGVVMVAWWLSQGDPAAVAVTPSVAVEDAAPPAQPRRWIPPTPGAPCRVQGEVRGGAAAQVSLHSVRAQIDVPVTLEEGGLRFHAELPEQGELQVVAVAKDGRTGSVEGRCDGSAEVHLVVQLGPAPDPNPAVTGRCIYLETGAPVPEARVRGARPSNDDRPAVSALTDADGRFALSAPPGLYEISCSKDGDASPTVRHLVEPGRTQSLVLLVAARASVVGSVRDDQGPLPGITVHGHSARAGWARTQASARTDATGRFILSGLSPGPVQVDAQHEGLHAEAEAVARVDLPYADVELHLRASEVTLEGRVTSGGEPVLDAVVRAEAADGSRSERRRRGPGWPGRAAGPPLRRSTQTDEDGGYVMGGLAAGRFRVIAEAPGRVAGRAEVELYPGRIRVDLSLSVACQTELRLESEGPSRPVEVMVASEDGTSIQVFGQTEESLRVETAPGTATILARTLGEEVASATVEAELCADPVPIVLSGGDASHGTLEVLTKDLEGAALPGIRVFVNQRGMEGRTNDEGRVRFDGLEPRSYRVRARAAKSVMAEVEAGQTVTVELRVDRTSGEIAGTVEQSGVPVEGAAVLAACGSSGRTPEMLGATIVARSDGAGAFSFQPEDGGSCMVRAEHRSRGRSRPALLQAGGAPARLELLASGQISGRAVRAPDQEPLTAYTLQVQSLGRAGAVEGRTLRVADPDGRFIVRDLAPGRVALIVDSAAGRARQEVQLGVGEHREDVELAVFSQGRVTGRVLGEEVGPIPGAKVRVEGRRPLGRVVTGQDGRFSVAVPAGESVSVFASATGHYPKGTPAFDLGASGATDVGDIVLSPRAGDEEKEGGIGIMFANDPRGIRVIRLMPDSPARDAGVAVGDVIVGIDGVPAGRAPIINWVTSLRGPAGTSVLLELERGTRPTFSVQVIRRAINLPAVPDEAP